tara:strand:+ start:3468 stop:3779 length:312 start_codon:yes stop_codon:yes gene_type:complete
MSEKKYAIINTSEIDTIDFEEVIHNNAQKLRINNAGTKCIISYLGRQPVCLDGKREYTGEEVFALMCDDTNEWYVPTSDVENGSWRVKIGDVLKRYNPFKEWF